MYTYKYMQIPFGFEAESSGTAPLHISERSFVPRRSPLEIWSKMNQALNPELNMNLNPNQCAWPWLYVGYIYARISIDMLAYMQSYMHDMLQTCVFVICACV